MASLLSEQASDIRSRCYRCNMSFAVAEPWHANSGDGHRETEVCRCPVPGCGRRFWHGSSSRRGEYVITVGVFPSDVAGTVDHKCVPVIRNRANSPVSKAPEGRPGKSESIVLHAGTLDERNCEGISNSRGDSE